MFLLVFAKRSFASVFKYNCRSNIFICLSFVGLVATSWNRFFFATSILSDWLPNFGLFQTKHSFYASMSQF